MPTKKERIDTHQPLAGILKQLRENHRYSKTELAKEVDVSKNHIGEIESGSCYPSFALLIKILLVYDYEFTIRRIPKFHKKNTGTNTVEAESVEHKEAEAESSLEEETE